MNLNATKSKKLLKQIKIIKDLAKKIVNTKRFYTFDFFTETVKPTKQFMTTDNQNTENQIKSAQIISAAQTVFGRYGMQKTTMKEIAMESGISKALLYYYFPDKEHLYKAVVEKEHQEFICGLLRRIEEMDSIESMLIEFVNIRLQYFRSLLNLSRFRMEDWRGMKTIMEDVWQSCRNKEIGVIKDILSKGKEKNIFHFNDEDEISEIFLDLLKGFSHIMVKRKEIFYLDQTEYDSLIKKVKIFTSIFIGGLKYH